MSDTTRAPITELLKNTKKLTPGKYIGKNGKSAKEKEHTKIGELVDDLLHDYIFKTYDDTEEILVYQGGRYIKNGEKIIKDECQRVVGNQMLTTHIVNEAIGHIQRSTYVNRKNFDRDPEIINLKNGLLNLNTNEFIEGHTPDYLSTIQIPVIYDPIAVCSNISKFFSEVLKQENIQLAHEIFGHCLVRNYSMQKAFLFIGDGANGKSTFLDLLREFLGGENCSSQSLYALETIRFAVAELEGKLANIFADLPYSEISRASMFKMLTGGDAIQAEEKFKQPFSFINYAKLLFSTNKPPTIDDDTFAFWRRWVMINFPNKFEGDSEDRYILQKLTTPEELSGLLNLSLEALKKLRQKGQFSYSKTVDEVSEWYKKASKPEYAFIEEWCNCKVGTEYWISNDELYKAYAIFCRKKDIPAIGKESLGRKMKNIYDHPDIEKAQRRVNGERVWGWSNIEITESAKREMEAMSALDVD